MIFPKPENKKERQELREIAYHEAGHAVVSIFLKVPFEYVTILPTPEENSLGHVGFCLKKEDLVEEIIVDCAGMIAQTKYNKSRSIKEIMFVSSSSDLKNINDLKNSIEKASQFSFSNEYQDKLISIAVNFINEDAVWFVIKKLVTKLMKFRTLSYRRVRTIVEKAEKEYIDKRKV